MSRPEYVAPPEVYYDADESEKYTLNTRVQQIQAEMTMRALDLLNLPPSQFVLDIGCGSGLSGEILTEEGNHQWIGMDISAPMLGNALDREVEGDLFLADMGAGVPFRAGTFDAAVSVSAIQWLCNADHADSNPKKRLQRFFETLYASLRRGGKAVCQFYPVNQDQIDQILHSAKVSGFGGGMIIDRPESKRHKKYYLVLTAGQGGADLNLEGVSMDPSEVAKKKKRKQDETKREFIKRKKESMRKRGKVVALDSKFSGRRRGPVF